MTYIGKTAVKTVVVVVVVVMIVGIEIVMVWR